MSDYAKLLEIQGDAAIQFQAGSSRCALFPDLGGRVFAEVSGLSVHRIDLENVASPHRAFNNFGGCNFWPAPEGGKLGFNYEGREWLVQECVNEQAFDVVFCNDRSASIEKSIQLKNCIGTQLPVLMRREITVSELPNAMLSGLDTKGCLSFTTTDSLTVVGSSPVENSLIASWTLEQFDGADDTISFCAVSNPREAINFDYYASPGDRITYFDKGFTYRTDGLCKGQIGVRKDAKPSLIGFYKKSQNLLCLRENRNIGDGLYFNIADNNQPGGPYTAADVYSIFNSDSDMKAFELETVGAMQVADGLVLGSELVSTTTFAVFDNADDIEKFVSKTIGRRAG